MIKKSNMLRVATIANDDKEKMFFLNKCAPVPNKKSIIYIFGIYVTVMAQYAER